MHKLAAGLSSLFLFIACNLPTNSSNNNSGGTGPVVKMTINDGTGAFSVNGTTSVTALTGGQVQVDVGAIELNAPGRQMHIQIWCNASDVGVPLAINQLTAPISGTAVYGKTATAMEPFAAGAGTTGSVTFDNLTLGDNTLTGSFSFTAINKSGGTVSITSGTFGK